jgi:hypothetical protein
MTKDTTPKRGYKNEKVDERKAALCPPPSEQVFFRQFLKRNIDLINVNKMIEVSNSPQLRPFIYREAAFTDYEQWVRVKVAFSELFSKMGKASDQWFAIKNSI